MKPLVAVIMGSDSDLSIMQGAVYMLKEMGIAHEVRVVSAHRTPAKMQSFAQKAAGRGLKVIIAGAGGAAHLPGMVAASTTLPVIGVPVGITALDGLDAMLSIVQMPQGVPVATMAVDNSLNAGLFAARILALHDKRILKRVQAYAQEQKAKVAAANKRLKARRS